MQDVGKWMQAHDPVAAGDAEIAPTDAQRMRRVVLAAAVEAAEDNAARLWPRPLAVAATIALTLASSVFVGRYLPLREPKEAARAVNQVAELRQMQIASPGGTRVIWVFNSEFQP